MSKFYVELMLAITEYNYFKPAAGIPLERTNHNPSFDYERNKKCTSITVIAGIVMILGHPGHASAKGHMLG